MTTITYINKPLRRVTTFDVRADNPTRRQLFDDFLNGPIAPITHLQTNESTVEFTSIDRRLLAEFNDTTIKRYRDFTVPTISEAQDGKRRRLY